MILSAFHFVTTLLLVACIFNLMIIVHELGHFLAARWRGMVVEEFGIWFGKPLWRKKIGGVWYSLGTIPFGGFVKLPQFAAMEGVEGKSETAPEDMPYISPLSKIIVAFAGPLFSFLLALSFRRHHMDRGPAGQRVGKDLDHRLRHARFPAAEAGLQAGDKILEIDGYKVNRWGGMGDDSITWRIVSSEGETLDMKVLRDGKEIELHPKPEVPATNPWERRAQRQIGIEPKETPVIGKVNPGTSAAQACLKPGDQIIAIDGKPIYDRRWTLPLAGEHPGEPVAFHDQTRRHETTLSDFRSAGPARAALVEDVIKDGPADKAGVLAKDRVVSVNGQPFVSAAKFTELIRQSEPTSR